jgi:hypothetical protein
LLQPWQLKACARAEAKIWFVSLRHCRLPSVSALLHIRRSARPPLRAKPHLLFAYQNPPAAKDMLPSGFGLNPALSLQSHNFVCAYLSADAEVSPQRCRFPFSWPGCYTLRPPLQSTRIASAPKPSNPHTPASSGAFIPENIFYKVPKTLLYPGCQNTAPGPHKDLVLKRSGQAACLSLTSD